MGIDFSKPNCMRDPLELISETEDWLYAEALAAERTLGTTPLIERLRGHAVYLRNVRLAVQAA